MYKRVLIYMYIFCSSEHICCHLQSCVPVSPGLCDPETQIQGGLAQVLALVLPHPLHVQGKGGGGLVEQGGVGRREERGRTRSWSLEQFVR